MSGLMAFPRGHVGAHAPRDSEPRARGPSMLLFSVFTRKVTDVMGLLVLREAARCLTLLISITGKPKLVVTVTANRAQVRGTGVAVSTP